MADYMISQEQLTRLGDNFRRNTGESKNYSWSDLVNFTNSDMINNAADMAYVYFEPLIAVGATAISGTDTVERNQSEYGANLTATATINVPPQIAEMIEYLGDDWLDYIAMPDIEEICTVRWSLGLSNFEEDYATIESKEIQITYYEGVISYTVNVFCAYYADAYKEFTLQVNPYHLDIWQWIRVIRLGFVPKTYRDWNYDYYLNPEHLEGANENSDALEYLTWRYPIQEQPITHIQFRDYSDGWYRAEMA